MTHCSIMIYNYFGDCMLSKGEIKAIISIFLFYSIIEILGITCPIKFLTGISCAGCGISRAFLSALKLDFKTAMNFHPLFWLVILAMIVFLFKQIIPIKFIKHFTYFFITCFISVYIVRLIFYKNNIVVFNPQNGLIYKIICNIIKGG